MSARSAARPALRATLADAVPEEPLALLRDRCSLVDDETLVAALLPTFHRSWHELLAPFGDVEEAIGPALRAGARECRLWLLGDRTWRQAAESVAGRVARRVPGEGETPGS